MPQQATKVGDTIALPRNLLITLSSEDALFA